MENENELKIAIEEIGNVWTTIFKRFDKLSVGGTPALDKLADFSINTLRTAAFIRQELENELKSKGGQS